MGLTGVLVLPLFLALDPGKTSISTSSITEMRKVGLAPEGNAFTLQTDSPQTEGNQIAELQGMIRWGGTANGTALGAWGKGLLFMLALVDILFFVVQCDLLRRLFRNVARGESFTARNIHLVHWMGGAIIVFTLVSSAAQTWGHYQVISYLQQHASVPGTSMKFVPPPVDSSDTLLGFIHKGYRIQIGWKGILSGLLVLALGEVFRQGVALKEETELTI